MVTAQDAVPEQAPDQPAKVEPPTGDAVKVTSAPTVKFPVQMAPQVMPAGFEVTVPVPDPFFATDRVLDGVTPVR
jgi:hypothetical protein